LVLINLLLKFKPKRAVSTLRTCILYPKEIFHYV
jgi:hypothetical protein